MTTKLEREINQEEVKIQTHRTVIKGDFRRPHKTIGVILFAHGAGSSRLSPRNKHVAEILQQAGFATLLMDLLSEEEDKLDILTGKLRFDIPLLAGRVDSATEWILENDRISQLPIGYFGASTGAAAALVASIQKPETISAIVCRGGRPDLANNILSEVKPPTLLIVGSEDHKVLEKNQIALKKLNSEKQLVIIPGASHLFEEPGKLDEVAKHAKSWFQRYLIFNEASNTMEYSKPHIDSYSFGHMIVNGRKYDKDLIIFPERIKDHWWRNNGHILRAADLKEVFEYKPELLVVGTGSSGKMQIEPSMKDSLRQEGIKIIEIQTGHAVNVFNKEMQKGAKVVGAFHLTC
jgi:dienelactone hydrolase